MVRGGMPQVGVLLLLLQLLLPPPGHFLQVA